jgi:dimethylargininase
VDDLSVTAFDRAIVREPGPSVVDGLRAGDHDRPSFAGVAAEHRAYVTALGRAGLSVDILPPLDAFPDSVFVEDPAFVLAEAAIVLRPGAASRIGEAEAIAPVLQRCFQRVRTLENGFVDGGDILVLPGEILVGLSARTDRDGAERFAALAAELGHRVRIVQTPPGVLHFKTACALLDEETVIATPPLAAAGCFEGLDVLTTPAGEEKAANLLRINEVVLIGADYPRTAEMLAKRGYQLVPLNVAEIRKIDAGLSCLSLRWMAAEE